MVGFVRKKIKSFTLSEKLRRIREEENVSLAEIAKETKIKLDYLEKIEKGLYNDLPCDVYVKGFLRSYAQYLGIDPEEVIRHYQREKGMRISIEKNNCSAEKKKKNWQFPVISISPKMITAMAFFFLVLGGFWYFYRQVGEFSRQPRLVVLSPTDNLSTSSALVEVSGITDRESQVTINDQPIYVDEEGNFKEELSLQRGMNNFKIKSVNRFKKEAERTIEVFADFEDQIPIAGVANEKSNEENININDQPIENENQNQSEEMTVEVRVEELPVWVLIKIDGERTQSSTMLAGSSQIFKAKDKVSITSGKANKTFVKINGVDFGPIGDQPGVERDVEFNREGRISND